MTIYHPGIGVDVLAQVVEYEWDVARGKPGKIKLGEIDPRGVGKMIPVWRIPGIFRGSRSALAGSVIVRSDGLCRPVVAPPESLSRFTCPRIWRIGSMILAIPIESAISNAEARLADAEDAISDAEGNISLLTSRADLFASDMPMHKATSRRSSKRQIV